MTSHDRGNVRWKVGLLASGDPRSEFGLTRLGDHSADEILAMVGEEAGFDPHPMLRDEPVPIDPWKVLSSVEAAGRRLALGADRGESIVVATGHPVGLIGLYTAVARLLLEAGAKLLTPAEGLRWRESGRRHEIRYVGNVAILAVGGSAKHTHSPGPMRRILGESEPDLVFADHGFAGAAIESGVETLSIADINDPALVVAKKQGRTETVIVMDDNVSPEDYWPCFQMIAAQFP